ncbi:MAG: hypothetical protein AB8B99_18890 [Phormidesmis sp.]
MCDNETERITAKQMRKFGAMMRGVNFLSADTVRTWRRRIGIIPDTHGFYELGDIKLLGRYLVALSEGTTTTQFLEQEYGKEHA